VFSDLKICIIGDGTHSKRIQSILRKKLLKFEIYKPKNKKKYKLENIKKLKTYDAVIIASPDDTHFHYIKELYRDCYIFCEKPPTNNLSDFKKLKLIDTDKLYFNFNFRFSKFAQTILESDKFNLGNLVYANLLNCHGLALKKEYSKSWRANRKRNKTGIMGIVSIHLIDLLNYTYGINKIISNRVLNLSKYGNSYDNNIIRIKLNNDAVADIFCSYTVPLISKDTFIYDNGVIEKDSSSITIKGPALNLNKNNFIKSPKILKKINFDDVQDSMNSIEKSITYFMSKVISGKKFKKVEAQIGLKSNSYVL